MSAPAEYRIAWQVLRALRSVVLTATAALGVISLLAVAAGLALDVRPLVVVSGSMEPTIPVGSLILARAEPAADAVVGDVVTVPRRAGTTDLVTHRVVETRDASEAAPGARELVLRGDANDTNDPSTYIVTNVRRHVATVPGGGYVVQTLQSPRGLIVVGGVLLAAIVLTFSIPQKEKRGRGGHRADGADRASAADRAPAADRASAADPGGRSEHAAPVRDRVAVRS